jgi:protein involved in polysaccharide export with SLBB domain
MARTNILDTPVRALSKWGQRLSLGLALAAGTLGPVSAGAQLRGDGRAGNATRSELETAARAAEQRGSAGRVEATALRARLQNGDFQPGDRIVVELRGDSSLFDTLTVRTGPSVRLAGLPDVSLQGVLRSELPDHLTKSLSRYIRQPQVRAESLVRLSVLGQVGKPGFYDFASDMLLTDAIMAAGGPTATAALDRSTVRRGPTVILAKADVERAAQTGATLDRLGLRPGDEITVGEKRVRNWQTIASAIGVVTSLAFAVAYLVR